MAEPRHGLDEVEAFLHAHHGEEVTGLELLTGGFWSAAYGYRSDGRDLVLRVGEIREGFEMDRAAMAFGGPGLPVPEVLDVGEGLGASYAISVRHAGRFLEDVEPDDAPLAGPLVERLLAALRAAPVDPDGPSDWFRQRDPRSDATWRTWLLAGLVDDPERHASGWRATLAADARLDRLFRACEGRVADLVEACPERRDLVHGDLLHRNVLLAEDLSAVTAVFSWKCSVLGDHLFDVAWCTFWGAWHPGIAALDLFDRTLRSPSLDPTDLVDAPVRHHCYELQIGASHLGWCAWTGDRAELERVAARTEEILERGPLPDP